MVNVGGGPAVIENWELRIGNSIEDQGRAYSASARDLVVASGSKTEMILTTEDTYAVYEGDPLEAAEDSLVVTVRYSGGHPTEGRYTRIAWRLFGVEEEPYGLACTYTGRLSPTGYVPINDDGTLDGRYIETTHFSSSVPGRFLIDPDELDDC